MAVRKKTVFPEKKTMNLYYRPDKTSVPATIGLYVLFAFTLLLAFAKLFIYDDLMEVEDLREQLAVLQREKSAYEESLLDYEEVQHEYRLYSAVEEEERQTDRIALLDLLDTAVRPYANIASLSVSDGYVTMQFSGISLKETSEIVQKLEQSPIVQKTVVNTAATMEEGSQEKEVTANILITLRKENEENEKTTVNP